MFSIELSIKKTFKNRVRVYVGSFSARVLFQYDIIYSYIMRKTHYLNSKKKNVFPIRNRQLFQVHGRASHVEMSTRNMRRGLEEIHFPSKNIWHSRMAFCCNNYIIHETVFYIFRPSRVYIGASPATDISRSVILIGII